MVSLDTENKHRLANPQTHSQHVGILFDGSTIRPKRRLVSSLPDDLEGFRVKYEIIANLADDETPLTRPCSTCKADGHLGSPPEMAHGLQEAMELEVAPGVLKAPGWHCVCRTNRKFAKQ